MLKHIYTQLSRQQNTQLSQSRIHFLICGAQKSGTTTLTAYLRRHEDLYIPAQKELHFFDDESINWQNPNYDSYHKQFANAHLHQKWGEATPIYMYWEPSAARIRQYNPNIKIIVILRNPITRAYSHWAMETGRGAENLDFLSAITNEQERAASCTALQHRTYSYIDRGFYSVQLQRLWHYFGRDQVLVLRHEDLETNPQTTLNTVFEYLKIGKMSFGQPLCENKGSYLEPIPSKAKQYLKEIYREEIVSLGTTLNWDLNDWLQ